ncbi:unnamed protein product, partial [Polarella glacialis]
AAAKSDLEGLAVEPEAAGPLGETTEEEIRRLERRVADMREVLQDKERVSLEWDKKLARCKRLREEADERARRVKRKVEDASYHHGVTVGKMRSSDGYFRYLYEDTQSDQQKKVISLKRSCALMEKQMDLLKGHVRLLLKVAAEDGSLAEGRSAPSELPDGELPKAEDGLPGVKRLSEEAWPQEGEWHFGLEAQSAKREIPVRGTFIQFDSAEGCSGDKKTSLSTAPAWLGASIQSILQSAVEIDDPLPSIGSAKHDEGACKRCCFFPKGRCTNGQNCEFCHFDHEKRKRKKKKKGAGSKKKDGEEDSDSEDGDSDSDPAPSPRPRARAEASLPAARWANGAPG